MLKFDIDPKTKQSDIEARVLALWDAQDTFKKLIAQTQDGMPWTMVDGPVTANNRLGVHHGWGRTYKDIYQRFNAMRGRRCLWQNGFDCQGLWVEVEVEKDLGLSGPKHINSLGVGKFADACRDRVTRFAGEIIDQSKLLGQWADWPNSYRTDSHENILHIWGFLKKCHDRHLLYHDNRVMPWCTRCGTSLSHHEMADSYQDRTDTAIYFLCPLRFQEKYKGQKFLVWTTTPWTVPANTALAVHPDLMYVMIRTADGLVWMSEACKNRLMPNVPVADVQPGSAFLGNEYVPPMRLDGTCYRVVPWEGVDKDTGSGFVHIAPAFGADDYNLWHRYNVDQKTATAKYYFHNFVPVDENGFYTHDELPLVKGRHWQKANASVVKDLADRKLLVKEEKVTHRYPHCWRCQEPVIFRQSQQWFIAVTKIREELIAAAKKVKWKPDFILSHMLNWLENMGDWCVSRRRFWGLPLPFYKCDDCHHVTVIGSFEELAEKAVVPFNVHELYDGSVHRPHIDSHVIQCGHCKKTVGRVKEVGDCWLDAGIVPFSTMNYRVAGRHPAYPFDFACEMREQVRLWFYSCLVMGVVLEGEAPFKTVCTYDEMRDGKGDKFSKTKGNAPVLDGIIREHGADVLRYACAVAPTDSVFLFGPDGLKKGKKLLNTLWNSVAYFAQNGSDERLSISGTIIPTDYLDVWLMNRLTQLVAGVTNGLHNHDARHAAFMVGDFIDGLSTWYIRLKRPVLSGPFGGDKEHSLRMLYVAFKTLAGVMAPLMPFTAEELYQKVVVPVEGDKAPASVHLTAFPVPDVDNFNDTVLADMRTVQDITQMGLMLRNAAKVKVRQPLRALYVENWPAAKSWMLAIIAQEVNVLAVKTKEAIPDGSEKVTCHDMVVGINLTLDQELLELGAVREVVRAVQDRRKELGLVPTDNIHLFVVAETPVWEVLDQHKKELHDKTRAKGSTRFKSFENGENFFEVAVLGGTVKLLVVKTK